jgi:hypothetical protein
MNRPREFLAWAVRTFGIVAVDRRERACRFIEESLELVHVEGLEQETVVRIVGRVYARPAGNLAREVGQAQATLECLAENAGLSADAEAEREFARVRAIPREQWHQRQNAKAEIGIAGAV